MKSAPRLSLAACLVAILMSSSSSAGADSLPGNHATGSQGAVSSGGAEAVAAGLEILRQGGNAADAAAATILALSVTDGTSFCFGGEVPIMVYDARRKVVETLSGQGAAPRLATREYFVAHGGIPARGLTAAAVPAAFDACVTLLDRYGTMRLADTAAPALRYWIARRPPGTQNLPARCAGCLPPRPLAAATAAADCAWPPIASIAGRSRTNWPTGARPTAD